MPSPKVNPLKFPDEPHAILACIIYTISVCDHQTDMLTTANTVDA